jgi:hypothetical protein
MAGSQQAIPSKERPGTVKSRAFRREARASVIEASTLRVYCIQQTNFNDARLVPDTTNLT